MKMFLFVEVSPIDWSSEHWAVCVCVLFVFWGFVRWRCFCLCLFVCLSRCHLSIGRRSTGLAATYDPTDPLAGCSSKRRLSLHPPPQVHSLTHSTIHQPAAHSLTQSPTLQPTTCSTIPNWTSSANQLIFNFQKILKKDDFRLKNHLKLHLTLYMSYIFWKHYDQGRWC